MKTCTKCHQKIKENPSCWACGKKDDVCYTIIRKFISTPNKHLCRSCWNCISYDLKKIRRSNVTNKEG